MIYLGKNKKNKKTWDIWNYSYKCPMIGFTYSVNRLLERSLSVQPHKIQLNSVNPGPEVINFLHAQLT